MATAKKTLAQADDERVRRAPSTSRRARSVDDALRADDEGLVTSTSERRKLFRDEWTQQALPNPPPIKGFHLCWLSTTNQWDPIARRARFGYLPVKVDEIPGYEHLKMHAGEYTGGVGINEMVLFKLPMQLYQQAMREFHHDQPLEEEGKIVRAIEELQENARDSAGDRLVSMEEGTESIVRRAKPTPFL